MSKKAEIIIAFDITDEFFKSKEWNEFQKEIVEEINTRTIYPGCNNAKVEIVID